MELHRIVDILNSIPDIQNKTYLELGVRQGDSFNNIVCKERVGVDTNSAAKPTHVMTTDDFFSKDMERFDLVYIDANHDYEYVLRDFNNVAIRANNYVFIHDMVPPDEKHAQPNFCSDSYKLLYYLLNYTNISCYPLCEDYGLTMIPAPFSVIDPPEEIKNITYKKFIESMKGRKLYTVKEINDIIKQRYNTKYIHKKNYTIYCPSFRPDLAKLTIEGFKPLKVNYHNGENYPSFSKLINDCIVKCPTEIVIIANDKVKATQYDVEKTLRLIDKGYGFVGLYRFGFFGFKKELIRKIGFLDERYVGGGCEDSDYLLRLKQNNIGVYFTSEINYNGDIRTSWDYPRARVFHNKKWVVEGNTIYKMFDEEKYDYDLGPSTGAVFLTEDKTYTTSPLVSGRKAYHKFINRF